MIKFDKVTKIYPSNTAVLKDVTFEIKEGEFVSIIGKSGAGKTTLTRLILGLEEPTYGEVYFKEKNMLVADASEIQKIRRSIGGIYQDYKLLPAKTVYENVSYVLEKINKAGATVILLTHNREIINKLGKRVITFVGGRIIRDEAEGRFII